MCLFAFPKVCASGHSWPVVIVLNFVRVGVASSVSRALTTCFGLDWAALASNLACVPGHTKLLNNASLPHAYSLSFFSVAPARYGMHLFTSLSWRSQKRLWTGVKAWKELTETWLQTPFTEIDAGVLEKHVTMYQRTCHQAVKGLPSNPVAKRLKARTSRGGLDRASF